MASLETLKNGYRVMWREGGRGSPKKYTPLITSKKDALAAKERIEGEVAANAPIRRGVTLPLVELLERWRVARVNDGNDPFFALRDKTRLLHHVTEQGWTTTADLTPMAVLTWRGDSDRTSGASRLWQAFLRWCRDYADQPIHAKVLVALRPPRREEVEPGRLLSTEEVAALEAKATKLSPDYGALVHCLATYGWRPITAARLTVADLDLDAGTIRTRVKSKKVKGGRVVVHPLHPTTLALLRPIVAGRKPEDPLFIDGRVGKAFDAVGAKGAGRTISLWCRDHLGEQVYNLKRYAISRLLEAMIPVKTIMLFTGHTTERQVYKYGRSNEEKQREALLRFPVAGEALPVVTVEPAAKAAKASDNGSAAVGHREARRKTPRNTRKAG